ncbi:MAG: glucose-6-phosphate dehydrogenase assembly protein OpcA [Betaproteobacteria bacterium]
MAATVTTRSRPTAPEAIDAALTALWREAGRSAPLARALLSNLVIVREHGPHEATDLTLAGIGLPLEAIVQQHPCRLIVIHHASGCSRERKPLAAAANVVTFDSGTSRFGIEAIVLSSECAEASLPSIVRRLAVGDIPTTLWWPHDFSRLPPLDALVDMGRQLLYDSRLWRDIRAGIRGAAHLLERPYPPDMADLNWRRLGPMRRALAQCASPRLQAGGVHTAEVHVQHRPGDAALAWLLVGWLDACLALPPAARAVTVEEARRGDEVLTVSIGGEPAGVTAAMNGHRVLAKLPNHTSPLVVAVPHESAADAIASELRSLVPDRCLHDTILALAARLTSGAA